MNAAALLSIYMVVQAKDLSDSLEKNGGAKSPCQPYDSNPQVYR